jgi:hypothetical protein
VIVMPLPLSEANAMLHPALTVEAAGRVTDMDAPGVLKFEMLSPSSIGFAT